MHPDDEHFMRAALREAELAALEGEVPVGAIVVLENQITGRGHNQVIALSDPTAHAEVAAIRAAALSAGNYRLSGATVYSTIEPCAMCAGALIHARIARLVYSSADPRAGAVDTHFGICGTDFLNHRIEVSRGVLESDSREMIQYWFREKRKRSL